MWREAKIEEGFGQECNITYKLFNVYSERILKKIHKIEIKINGTYMQMFATVMHATIAKTEEDVC